MANTSVLTWQFHIQRKYFFLFLLINVPLALVLLELECQY